MISAVSQISCELKVKKRDEIDDASTQTKARQRSTKERCKTSNACIRTSQFAAAARSARRWRAKFYQGLAGSDAE